MRQVQEIGERTLEFGVLAIRLYQTLGSMKDGAAWIIGKQFLRSATSVGANIAEAKGAESPADFTHKCGIAEKEARETAYWLALLEKAEMLPPEQLAGIKQEVHEITAIIVSMIVNTKKRMK